MSDIPRVHESGSDEDLCNLSVDNADLVRPTGVDQPELSWMLEVSSKTFKDGDPAWKSTPSSMQQEASLSIRPPKDVRLKRDQKSDAGKNTIRGSQESAVPREQDTMNLRSEPLSILHRDGVGQLSYSAPKEDKGDIIKSRFQHPAQLMSSWIANWGIGHQIHKMQFQWNDILAFFASRRKNQLNHLGKSTMKNQLVSRNWFKTRRFTSYVTRRQFSLISINKMHLQLASLTEQGTSDASDDSSDEGSAMSTTQDSKLEQLSTEQHTHPATESLEIAMSTTQESKQEEQPNSHAATESLEPGVAKAKITAEATKKSAEATKKSPVFSLPPKEPKYSFKKKGTLDPLDEQGISSPLESRVDPGSGGKGDNRNSGLRPKELVGSTAKGKTLNSASSASVIVDGWIEHQTNSKMGNQWEEVFVSLRRNEAETTLWVQREVIHPKFNHPQLKPLYQIPVELFEDVTYLEDGTGGKFSLKVHKSPPFVFRCRNEPVATKNWAETLKSAKHFLEKQSTSESFLTNQSLVLENLAFSTKSVLDQFTTASVHAENDKLIETNMTGPVSVPTDPSLTGDNTIKQSSSSSFQKRKENTKTVESQRTAELRSWIYDRLQKLDESESDSETGSTTEGAISRQRDPRHFRRYSWLEEHGLSSGGSSSKDGNVSANKAELKRTADLRSWIYNGWMAHKSATEREIYTQQPSVNRDGGSSTHDRIEDYSTQRDLKTHHFRLYSSNAEYGLSNGESSQDREESTNQAEFQQTADLRSLIYEGWTAHKSATATQQPSVKLDGGSSTHDRIEGHSKQRDLKTHHFRLYSSNEEYGLSSGESSQDRKESTNQAEFQQTADLRAWIYDGWMAQQKLSKSQSPWGDALALFWGKWENREEKSAIEGEISTPSSVKLVGESSMQDRMEKHSKQSELKTYSFRLYSLKEEKGLLIGESRKTSVPGISAFTLYKQVPKAPPRQQGSIAQTELQQSANLRSVWTSNHWLSQRRRFEIQHPWNDVLLSLNEGHGNGGKDSLTSRASFESLSYIECLNDKQSSSFLEVKQSPSSGFEAILDAVVISGRELVAAVSDRRTEASTANNRRKHQRLSKMRTKWKYVFTSSVAGLKATSKQDSIGTDDWVKIVRAIRKKNTKTTNALFFVKHAKNRDSKSTKGPSAHNNSLSAKIVQPEQFRSVHRVKPLLGGKVVQPEQFRREFHARSYQRDSQHKLHGRVTSTGSSNFDDGDVMLNETSRKIHYRFRPIRTLPRSWFEEDRALSEAEAQEHEEEATMEGQSTYRTGAEILGPSENVSGFQASRAKGAANLARSSDWSNEEDCLPPLHDTKIHFRRNPTKALFFSLAVDREELGEESGTGPFSTPLIPPLPDTKIHFRCNPTKASFFSLGVEHDELGEESETTHSSAPLIPRLPDTKTHFRCNPTKASRFSLGVEHGERSEASRTSPLSAPQIPPLRDTKIHFRCSPTKASRFSLDVKHDQVPLIPNLTEDNCIKQQQSLPLKERTEKTDLRQGGDLRSLIYDRWMEHSKGAVSSFTEGQENGVETTIKDPSTSKNGSGIVGSAEAFKTQEFMGCKRLISELQTCSCESVTQNKFTPPDERVDASTQVERKIHFRFYPTESSPSSLNEEHQERGERGGNRTFSVPQIPSFTDDHGINQSALSAPQEREGVNNSVVDLRSLIYDGWIERQRRSKLQNQGEAVWPSLLGAKEGVEVNTKDPSKTKNDLVSPGFTKNLTSKQSNKDLTSTSQVQSGRLTNFSPEKSGASPLRETRIHFRFHPTEASCGSLEKDADQADGNGFEQLRSSPLESLKESEIQQTSDFISLGGSSPCNTKTHFRFHPEVINESSEVGRSSATSNATVLSNDNSVNSKEGNKTEMRQTAEVRSRIYDGWMEQRSLLDKNSQLYDSLAEAREEQEHGGRGTVRDSTSRDGPQVHGTGNIVMNNQSSGDRNSTSEFPVATIQKVRQPKFGTEKTKLSISSNEEDGALSMRDRKIHFRFHASE